MKEEKRKLNVVLWSRNCFVVRQFSSPRATEMTLGLKQQSEKNVYKTRKLPLRSVHCNTCMISLFSILWTIPSWNIGQTIKKRKTAKLLWFWTILISRKFTNLGIVWVFNLCAEPSSPLAVGRMGGNSHQLPNYSRSPTTTTFI